MIALRAQATSERASRYETFVSLLIRLSVSSTIMRILRRRRRSKNPERVSAAGSISFFGIVVSRRERGFQVVNSARTLQLLCVLAIAFGPDLCGEIFCDA